MKIKKELLPAHHDVGLVSEVTSHPTHLNHRVAIFEHTIALGPCIHLQYARLKLLQLRPDLPLLQPAQQLQPAADGHDDIMSLLAWQASDLENNASQLHRTILQTLHTVILHATCGADMWCSDGCWIAKCKARLSLLVNKPKPGIVTNVCARHETYTRWGCSLTDLHGQACSNAGRVRVLLDKQCRERQASSAHPSDNH